MTDHLDPTRDATRADQSERQVIGTMLIGVEGEIDTGIAELKEGDFFLERERSLYRVMKSLRERRVEINGVSVLKELMKLKIADDVFPGGEGEVLRLLQDTVVDQSFRYHVRQVRSAGVRRHLHEAGRKMQAAATDVTRDEPEVIAAADTLVREVQERQVGTVGTMSLMDTLVAAMERDEGAVEHITTGFADVDRTTDGIARGHMVIVGARPSMGKTALALCLMRRMAATGSRVLFFSLEQPMFELIERLLSIETKRPKSARRDISDTQIHWELTEAQNKLGPLPINIHAEGGLTASRIGAIARMQKRRQGLDVVLIDYLQLIEPEDGRVPREQQVATMSRRLKWLANDIQAAVIVLAQLNRESEKTGGKPQLSHLRESGALEQDADQVWLLWREYKALQDKTGYTDETDEMRNCKNQADLIIAKNRQGETGNVKLTFQPEIFRFDNFARGDF